MNYIFLDENRHVESFEKAVDSLFIKENCDVYITGSNAYFMSGELATLLSGRYVELKMLPLSFREFSGGILDTAALTRNTLFNLYLENGSFPYTVQFGDRKREAREYLQDIYKYLLTLDEIFGTANHADISQKKILQT